MGLYKNRKGIIHSLHDGSPQVKKWLKDEQITKLSKDEEVTYAKSLGIDPKKKKAAPKAKAKAPAATAPAEPQDTAPETQEDPDPQTDDSQPDEAQDEAPKTEIDQLRDEYTKVFAEAPNSRWNAATLKKKLAEVAPK